MNIKLLDIVQENLPNFNPELEADLIKAEKILKAASKNDASISQNDIEDFIRYFKEKGKEQVDISALDANILHIIEGKYLEIDKSIAKNFQEKVNLSSLAEDFASQIQQFIAQCIRKFDWNNLIKLVLHYRSIINTSNEYFLKESLSNKNDLIISTLRDYSKYKYFLDEYSFALDGDFFKLQSTVDAYYFEDEINALNSAVTKVQDSDSQSKAYLGQIVMALYSFQAINEELNQILHDNYEIGKSWVKKQNALFRFIAKVSSKIMSKVVLIEKLGAVINWIFIILFIPMIQLGLNFLYKTNEHYFDVLLGLELILFLTTNSTLNSVISSIYKPYDELLSFRQKINFMIYKILLLQIYVSTILLGIGLLMLVFAFLNITGGPGFFILFLVIGILFTKNDKKKAPK